MAFTYVAADFKAYFTRNQFLFGSSYPAVTDQDITNAILDANNIFNPDLFPDDATGKNAFNFLVAHMLQTMLDTSSAQGQSSLLETARSSQGVSQSLAVPEWMLEGDYAFYATTGYGQRYLSLCKPYLGGVVYSSPGGTQP